MRTVKETKAALLRDCRTRIRDLKGILDSIESKLDRGYILNDLGEMQGVAVILDCRLASLATIQNLKDD